MLPSIYKFFYYIQLNSSLEQQGIVVFSERQTVKTDKLLLERKTHYIELENHIHTFTETHGNGVSLQG